MDENIKLNWEKLLFIGDDPDIRIKHLNDMGIFTIADFINADVTTLLESKANSTMKNQFIVYQQILGYKYRGQKMVRDIYLDREYHIVNMGENHFPVLTSAAEDAEKKEVYTQGLLQALDDLGFRRFFMRRGTGSFSKFEQISMIDAIKQIAQLDPDFKPLSDFYIEYYEKEIKKPETKELDLQNAEALKNEIVRLLGQRYELDSKISQLVEQVNALEGGSISNGRK